MCTDFQFKYGSDIIEIVPHYKYLGVIFDEFLTFELAANTLAGAAGRALGKLWSVYKGFNGLGYASFTKLFESYVDPILLYCASIWNVKPFKCCADIQNRAIRSFLGVHRFAPLLSINGDMAGGVILLKQTYVYLGCGTDLLIWQKTDYQKLSLTITTTIATKHGIMKL